MVRYTGPKNRIARRFGINLFGRTRNPLLHKANPPGQHGAKKKKKSDYGLQLEEKQKLRACYGMLTQKQLSAYYKESARRGGSHITNLMQLLESRLDILVYRMGFAPTIFAAQQLVAHGHITVNGKKVDRRSFSVKPGNVLAVKEASRNIQPVKLARENPMKTIPPYCEVNLEQSTGTYVSLPEVQDIPLPLEINIATVCEFLAHNT
jgi:small subunit ribosomal protein S4